jgi:hypothetical protein
MMTSRGQCPAVWICKFPEKLLGASRFGVGLFLILRGNLPNLFVLDLISGRADNNAAGFRKAAGIGVDFERFPLQ